jgi:hypothetical protein
MAALLMSRCCLSPATDGSKTRSCEDDCPQDVRAVQSHPGDRAQNADAWLSASHRQCPGQQNRTCTYNRPVAAAPGR